VRWTLDKTVQLGALTDVTVMCSWTRNMTQKVLLFSQVYKRVLAISMLEEGEANPVMDEHQIQEGLKVLLVT